MRFSFPLSLSLSLCPVLGFAQAADGPLITPGELSKLRAAHAGDRVALSSLPVSAKSRGSAVLKRLEVYAPGAKVFVVDKDGPREVPRSADLQFISESGPRMALSIAADGSSASGVLYGEDGANYALHGARGANGLALAVGHSTDSAPDGKALSYNTDGLEDQLEAPPEPKGAADAPAMDPATGNATNPITGAVDVTAAAVASRQAVISIDTDNEFMNLKFQNSSANATAYIASLFTQMNAIYNRDLDLTLVQGTTFLRPSTTADPYTSTSATDTGTQLDEFGEYWRTHNASIPTALVLMLSGKSSSAYSSSGIAWLLPARNYCTATGTLGGGGTYGHFALNRVFLYAGSTAASDTMVSAHELGHNFGAAHSHCTSNATGASPTGTGTIDQCYNGEGGCWSGPKTCPPTHTVNGVGNVTGTLMSYCHLSGLSGCGTGLVFADVQRNLLNGYIGASYNYPSCITPADGGGGGGSANQAPAVGAPASIAANEDQSVAITGVSFTDPDAGSGSLSATFSVASGTLSATSGSGVTVGGSAGARTLSGTLSALNAFLAAGKLSYLGAANLSGGVTLSIGVNDNGNSGTGGALSASDSMTIQVAAVNDAPTLSAPASIAVAEDTATSLTGIAFADVDAGGASLTATFTVASGSLGAPSCAGVTAGGNASTRTLTGSLTALDNCIAGGAFKFTPAQNATAGVTLVVQLSDNGNTGSGGAKSAASANVALNVSGVNDAPTLSLPQSYTITAGAGNTLGGIALGDVDAGAGALTLTLGVSTGTLSAQGAGGVTVSGSGTATLTLSGSAANLANFVDASVTFNAPPAFTAGTLNATLNDNGNSGTGGAKSASGSASLAIVAGGIFTSGFE